MAQHLLCIVSKTKIMIPIYKEIAESRKVVEAYIEALNRLDVEPIAFLIHPQFWYKYPSGFTAYGIRSELRYLGNLYQTFSLMKAEGKKISAELVMMREESIAYPCVKINPPHDRRIIFPCEERLIKSMWIETPENPLYLRMRIKDGKIFRIRGLLHPTDYDNIILPTP